MPPRRRPAFAATSLVTAATVVAAILCSQPASAEQVASTRTATTAIVECDVLVAGGSLASLAAAAAAANTSSSARVCFLDPTDWPGGQMTASAVPAIDFGQFNSESVNLPSTFAGFLFGDLMPGATNLGQCWVSKKCFTPTLALEGFVFPLLAAFPNLSVYLNTAVSFAQRDPATGVIASVLAVHRIPVGNTTGWEALTSTMLADWYDVSPSPAFAKELIKFQVSPGGVVIEATEFGDVLMTAGLHVAQGIEVPAESSVGYDSGCGQGVTVPFYVSYSEVLAPSPDPWPPGNPEGLPYRQQGFTWEHDWCYRRVVAGEKAGVNHASYGDVSVINVGGGNDFDNGYLFYPLGSDELAQQLAQPLSWRGGVNVTAYAAAEQRSLGFYHWFLANASSAIRPHLTLNASLAGTATGLSKMPYLRDTRRSAGGLDGFRVMYADLNSADPAHNNATSHTWHDVIGIGEYWFADIHTMTASVCPMPGYIHNAAHILPYYLPFRALTVDGAPNLLVAGKSMAMSFWANAAIRLHPEEWVSGMSAGTAAAIMHAKAWNASQMYDNVATLQRALQAAGQPLDWTL